MKLSVEKRADGLRKVEIYSTFWLLRYRPAAALPNYHSILRQHVPNSGAESGVSGLRKLLGALARALGVLHLAHWS